MRRIEEIKARQTELTNIKRDINEALANIRDEMEHISQLRGAEEQIIESNLNLIKMLENEVENEGAISLGVCANHYLAILCVSKLVRV